MKHVVLTPKGNTYLIVYALDGKICMKPNKSPYALFLDTKAIPQLINILQDIEKEIE